MYKPKTTHYLYDLEYLLEKYKNERPTGMCPDEWDMKIIGCTPTQYFYSEWLSWVESHPYKERFHKELKELKYYITWNAKRSNEMMVQLILKSRK
tara:strand:+ start:124 stop:408 length:285 start_codon:yes stop_codon:yes gene_type:complete